MNMAQRFNINENLTAQVALLATGSICAMSGVAATVGFAVFAAPMTGIAGWSVAKFWTRLKSKDPTTYKAVERIRTDINQNLIGRKEFVSFSSQARKAADDELSELIARFWPQPEIIAKLSSNSDAFPKAIADHVLNEINGWTFSSGMFDSGPAYIYARIVIESAMRGALSDQTYFQSLEPHVLMKTLGCVGKVGRDVEALAERLDKIEYNIGEAFTRVEAKVDTLQVTADEILRVVKQGQSASPEEDRAARQTFAEMLTSGRLSSMDAVRELMGDTPNPAAATNRLKQAIAEQADARKEAKQNEIALLEEIIAINYFTNGPEAIDALKSIIILQPNDDENLNLLGLLYHRLSQFGYAVETFVKLISLGIDESDKSIQAKGYGNLGNVADTCRDLEHAEYCYGKALELSEELGDKEAIAIQYGNLGIVARKRNELGPAQAYFLKSLGLSKDIDHKIGIANQNSNLGIIEAQQGRLDKAVTFFQKSLKMFLELKDKGNIANLYGNLSVAEGNRGNFEIASTYIQKAIDLDSELGNKVNTGLHLKNLGELECATKSFSLGRTHLKQALKIFIELDIQSHILEVTNLLHELDKRI